jgi:DNA-binding MarR family transcriptional regulator
MLAERAQRERAIVSRHVTALVAKALVQRIEQAGDRRRAELVVTPAGQNLYRPIFPRLAQISRRLMAALDANEAALFEPRLDKPTVRARQIRVEGGDDEARADRRHGGSRRFLQTVASGTG